MATQVELSPKYTESSTDEVMEKIEAIRKRLGERFGHFGPPLPKRRSRPFC